MIPPIPCPLSPPKPSWVFISSCFMPNRSTQKMNPRLLSTFKGIDRNLNFLHQQGNNGESIDDTIHIQEDRISFTRMIKEMACIVPDSRFVSNFPTEIPMQLRHCYLSTAKSRKKGSKQNQKMYSLTVRGETS